MSTGGGTDMEETLPEWMDREMRFASSAVLEGVSATGLTMNRDSFGQTIVPKRGSIVAAPATDPSGGDPDYFFHWLRDSALIMDAARILHRRGALAEAPRIVDDFAAFSLGLNRLDGPSRLRQGDIRKAVKPDFLKYVRSDEDLMGVGRDTVPGEVRFNADGTLDIIRWSRPQNDGPALRALSLLRWRKDGGDLSSDAAELTSQDLAYTEKRWEEPCYDLWEEQSGHHYYTRLVQLAALDVGAEWVEANGDAARAGRLRSAAAALGEQLNRHWSPERGFYLSRAEPYEDDPRKDLDGSFILAVLHADRSEGPHSVLDPKAQATLVALEDLFRAEYRINDSLRPGRGPAMGRYAGDFYASGGAWYMITLAAAEFYYRLARRIARSQVLERTGDNVAFIARVLGERPEDQLGDALIARGDAFMATVKDYAPASGELSEQFDQRTGEQTSAKKLAWSYAAFITAYDARERAAVPS